MGKRNNIKIKLIVLIMIAMAFISSIIAVTFARYAKEVDVSYNATTGQMICEFELEQDDSYIENDIKYFLIKVKNYRENSDGSTTITNVEENYSLTIQNKNNSNGLYSWARIDNEDSGSEYSNTITTNSYTFGNTEKEEVTFKVYVKLDSSVTEDQNVDIDVAINAEQIEKVTTFERGET